MKTLEDELQEIRPVPDPDFVADMEWRMRRGFPRERKRRLPSFAPRPVIAVAASMLLAGVVVVSLTGGDEQAAPPQAVTDVAQPETDAIIEQSPTALEGRVSEDSAGASIGAAPPSTGGGDIAPGAEVRRIERSAQLTLASDPDEFDRLANAIFRTADRRNGFVLQSSFTQGQEGFSSGFFELRVPSAQLQTTLNELSGLATVRARGETGTDVTGTFVSVRDRLRTARALRTSLLRRLELAVTDTAVSALRRRLEIVGNRITGLRAELRGLRERTEYATVFVELVDKDAGAATGETDEAIDDAVGSLEDVLNFLIRAIGVLLPLMVAGGIGWLAFTRARRRARERALA